MAEPTDIDFVEVAALSDDTAPQDETQIPEAL